MFAWNAEGFSEHEQTVILIVMWDFVSIGTTGNVHWRSLLSPINKGHFSFQRSGLNFLPNGYVEELGEQHFAYGSARK